MSQATLLPVPLAPSVSLHSGRPATTSRDVAKFFGKRHDNVVRSIQDLISNTPESFSALNFEAAEYTDEQGKQRLMFILYRDGFMLLVMGYTGKKALAVKLAYIEAFNCMEAELAKRPRRKNIADDIVPAPLTPEEARRERYRLFLERVEATRLDVTRQLDALRNEAVATLLPAELWLQGDRLIATALTWLDTWLVKEVTSILPMDRKENDTLLRLLMCAAYMPCAPGRVFLK